MVSSFYNIKNLPNKNWLVQLVYKIKLMHKVNKTFYHLLFCQRMVGTSVLPFKLEGIIEFLCFMGFLFFYTRIFAACCTHNPQQYSFFLSNSSESLLFLSLFIIWHFY